MSVKTTTPNYLGFWVRMNPGCDFCAKASVAIVGGAFRCEDHDLPWEPPGYRPDLFTWATSPEVGALEPGKAVPLDEPVD